MNVYFDVENIPNCEETLRKSWESFRNDLATKKFAYYDMIIAKNTNFLKTFDDLFQNCAPIFDITAENIFTQSTCVIRAARIKPGDPEPDYLRFIPDATYMTYHNRFSPPDVEWLYLSFADYNEGDCSIAEKCALKECGASKGDHFAICNFRLKNDFANEKFVDFTIAKGKSFDEINDKLLHYMQTIYKQKPSNTINKNDIKSLIEWTAYTYAKMLSEQIFLPLTTEDKSIMYAPFQCLAQYFLSQGYKGIVYSSTVFPSGTNLVLFDKTMAFPTGTIKNIIL